MDSLEIADSVRTKKSFRPRLVLPVGDPAGIGIEVTLQALNDPEVTKNCDVTVIGDRAQLIEHYEQLNPETQKYTHPNKLSVIDVGSSGSITIGTGNAISGKASFDYLEKAIARTLAGEFEAIVTAPIAKSAWKAAGYNYPGQT